MWKHLIVLVSLVGIPMSHAQLVITEVMAQAATNLGPAIVPQNSDFWELSNFGTAAVDLTGYSWNDDSGGLAEADPAPFVGLTIGPGESVIFVSDSDTTTEQQFRDWWGAGLGASVQIRFYSGNGFGAGGDGVRLWAPGATSDENTVASVDFGEALRGTTFTYDPDTGQFGALSLNGVNGAFKAVLADDVGSPGVTTGPVETTPPTIQGPPTDLVVYIGQNATFTVLASGSPPLTYQWRFNGEPIGGAVGDTYTLSNAQVNNAGVYSVVVSNPHGAATNEATLAVTERPRLVITEVSSAQSPVEPVANHNDWWELTNLDDFAVDLFGYRFDDSSATLAAAYTIPQHVVIAPGESVIFIEDADADDFIAWWGAGNLNPELQIIGYDASGLGLGAGGDAVYLWNQGATSDADTIASAVFGAATEGVTFGFNPETETFGELSVAGVHGAFVSAQSGDVGSPGTIGAVAAEVRIERFTRSNGDYQLTWSGPAGQSYDIEFRNEVTGPSWAVLTNVTSTAGTTTVTLPNPPSPTGQRYFRVVLQP